MNKCSQFTLNPNMELVLVSDVGIWLVHTLLEKSANYQISIWRNNNILETINLMVIVQNTRRNYKDDIVKPLLLVKVVSL